MGMCQNRELTLTLNVAAVLLVFCWPLRSYARAADRCLGVSDFAELVPEDAKPA